VYLGNSKVRCCAWILDVIRKLLGWEFGNVVSTKEANIYGHKQAWDYNVIYVYNRTPLIRTLVIRFANYPDRFGPSGKYFPTVIVLHLFMA
jgi:hypothetical protein